ncbi:hypothetical protein H1R20_g9261, partial [Candolleomyces eurysporus]
MSSQTENVLIGVIGGSGLYHLDHLTVLHTVNPLTPWGYPSSPITVASLPSGTRIAFLARHGIGHTISPSAVPNPANIAALKSLGVKAVIAFSAVGSLREEISPGSFVLPTQVIDRTKGVRQSSFFDGTTIVAHAMFGDPFSSKLIEWLVPRIEKALEPSTPDEPPKKVFTDKTAVCMEGPQFSTRAESLLYRQWGADIINMSVLPESKLAREAELSYALVAMATDYDCWRPHSESVTAHSVLDVLHNNSATAKNVLSAILDDLQETLQKEGEEGAQAILLQEKGGMAFSIMPRSAKQDPNDRKKLAYVLPEYFGDE